MRNDRLLERFLDPLLEGRRQECRQVFVEAIEAGVEPDKLYRSMIWPAMEHVARLYRADQINAAQEHMATRINRLVADQLQAFLQRNAPNGKRILIACADGEPEELGAQMCADLFESDGWVVHFLGGGVPHAVLPLVPRSRPCGAGNMARPKCLRAANMRMPGNWSKLLKKRAKPVC